MKFSVIVPVYNIENYINECVDSILNQTFVDYELLLVDDGSIDRSGQICDEYQFSDQRVKVIHKSNGGLSDARNAGLNCATGDYVYFVDGDDYIHPETLNSFAELIDQESGSDIILGRMTWFIEEMDNFSPDQFDVPNEFIQTRSGQDVFCAIVNRWGTMRMGVRGAYKRLFLLQNDLFFRKGLYAEDMEWTVRIFMYAQSVASNNKPYYYYRDKRPGSLVNSLSLRKFKDLLLVFEQWEKWAESEAATPCFRSTLLKETGKRYFNTYRKFNRVLPKTEINEFYSEVKRSKKLLQYAQAKPAKLLRFAIVFPGLKITSNILRTIDTKRNLGRMSRYES